MPTLITCILQRSRRIGKCGRKAGHGEMTDFNQRVEFKKVWRISRQGVTHNRYFESIEELRAALISQFEK